MDFVKVLSRCHTVYRIPLFIQMVTLPVCCDLSVLRPFSYLSMPVPPVCTNFCLIPPPMKGLVAAAWDRLTLALHHRGHLVSVAAFPPVA